MLIRRIRFQSRSDTDSFTRRCTPAGRFVIIVRIDRDLRQQVRHSGTSIYRRVIIRRLRSPESCSDRDRPTASPPQIVPSQARLPYSPQTLHPCTLSTLAAGEAERRTPACRLPPRRTLDSGPRCRPRRADALVSPHLRPHDEVDRTVGAVGRGLEVRRELRGLVFRNRAAILATDATEPGAVHITIGGDRQLRGGRGLVVHRRTGFRPEPPLALRRDDLVAAVLERCAGGELAGTAGDPAAGTRDLRHPVPPHHAGPAARRGGDPATAAGAASPAGPRRCARRRLCQ